MIEGGHDAVGIEREIVGLELVAGQQIELLLFERQLLGVEHKADPLAASRLRRVVQDERHQRHFVLRGLCFDQAVSHYQVHTRREQAPSGDGEICASSVT